MPPKLCSCPSSRADRELWLPWFPPLCTVCLLYQKWPEVISISLKDWLDISGRMKSAVIWLPFLQLVLKPTLVMDYGMNEATKKFRLINVDYPKVRFSEGFGDYCNGLMAHVRGIKKSWFCPRIHYVVHAPWNALRATCKHSDSFCENFNEYCSFTKDAFPITICTLNKEEPPTSCQYQSTITNQKIYLLCSRKYDADPIGIIGLY
ncbi:probable inactive ribonuclease-like protein 13 isoform X2 [Erinaceus europaeus]|uniref:Probable inactive ribonuclease-like protein 13 isoform X2 n=1 Tax=Erinaceus europaeus TaxID=9365 RepID=A0ABM3W419_ERIEU|nr:probable inactive ribonuclease-like protein 13 isoform X2 [Erinaceus europaeus]